jgi:hypothetical protein
MAMPTKILVSFCTSLTLVCLLAYFLLVGSPVFGTNDDVAMAMISAGVLLAHQPTSSLLFIHPIYGKLLQILYTANGEVPWYGILFIIILCLSLSVLSFSSLRVGKERSIYLAAPLIFSLNLFVIFPALYHLQFTIVSGVSSLAGFILLSSIFIKAPRSKTLFLIGITISLLMMFIGVMIRIDSFYMVCLLVAPTTLILFSRALFKNFSYSYGYTFKVFFLTFAFIVFGVVSLGIIQASYYSSSNWENWFALNKFKASLIDYQLIEYNDETKSLFREVGWSEIDYNMIRSWQYVDSNHFSVDKFRHIADSVEAAKIIDSSKILSRLHNHLLRVIGSAKKVPFLALTVLILFVCCLSRPIRYKQLGSATVLASFSLAFLYLSVVLNRTEFRSDLLMLIVLAWILLFLLLLREPTAQQGLVTLSDLPKKNLKISWVLVTLILVLWIKYDVSQASSYVKSFVSSGDDFQENVLEVWDANLPANSIIYVVGAAFPYEYYLPLRSLKPFRVESSKGFIATGTINQSPIQIETLKSLGLDENFFQSLLIKERVYLFTAPNPDDQLSVENLLQDFYVERYNAYVKFESQPNLPRLHLITSTLPTPRPDSPAGG